MFSDKTLKIALLVSIIGHSLLLYRMPGFARILPYKKTKNYPQVVHYELKKDLPAKLLIKEKKTQFKVDIRKEREQPIKKRESLRKVTPEQKERITLQSEEILKKASEEKSLYLDYYQTIREMIRRIANHNYYKSSNVGEVFLSFILGSDGDLKDIELVNNKSSSDRDLIKIAFNSVKKASPFPPFPKDLNQRHLSFNVIISFEKSD